MASIPLKDCATKKKGQIFSTGLFSPRLAIMIGKALGFR